MAIRKAGAVWDGNLKDGEGSIVLGEDGLRLKYGYDSRFGDHADGTNPEELVGGAHAGCFSMALSYELEAAGHPPVRIETTAHVHLTKDGEGFSIPKIDLETAVDAPGLEEAELIRVAESAKNNCPVSKLYKGAEIVLQAHLLSTQRT